MAAEQRFPCGKLVVSPRTIETHVKSVFTRLGLLPTVDEHRRVRAVVTYLQAG